MEEWNVLYEKAYRLASRVHAGQRDKGGNLYIYHPLAVADMVEKPEEKIVALLHDVVEDTPVTIAELEKEFPKVIVQAVELLTKQKGKDFSRKRYFEKIRENPVARQVKLADLAHNMDLSRIPDPQPRDYRRREQYVRDMEFLKREDEF